MRELSPIGIVQTSVYFPPGMETAEDLAVKTGIPEQVIIEKFGLYQKHVADSTVHTSDLAIAAARPILENIDSSIDVLIYFGSPHKDYPVWSAAAKIQYELGLHQAYAFEIMNVSSCFPIALKVAKDMLTADSSINNILLVGGCKESQIIDYYNPRSRFMFNFADGGAAALISKISGEVKHHILGSHIITDGSFYHQVKVPAGGTVRPATIETVQERQHYIDVLDPMQMKEGLDLVSLPNFYKVIDQALQKSGYGLKDIDWLIPLHTKKSMFLELLHKLGLQEEQAIYLDHHGHMSALDPCIGLHFLQEQERLKRGDIIVTVSAGTGYTWAATVLECQ